METQKEKIKILFCGSSLSSFSGFSYISQSILKRFYDTRNYEIYYVTIGGDESDPKNFHIWGEDFAKTFKNLICFNCQNHLQDTYQNFDKIIERIKPSIVFVVSDIWQLEPICLSPYRNSFLLVLYSTIETPEYPEFAMFPSLYDNNLRKSIKNLFQRCDIIIPVTNMARNALIKLGIDFNVTENVYNGIDFNKRVTKKYSKQEIFNNTIPEDTFMFFSVSENSDRKLLDRMIYAFKLFLTKVENPNKYRLYIHTNFADIKGGTDLLSMVVNNKLENYIILPRNFVDNQFMPTEILYQRYSVSDCYLSLTGGEGFGLGVVEAMMHKVPVIYSTYGAPSEYMKGIGYPVNVQTYINAKNIDVKWGLVDLEEASDQMLYMVENREKAKQMAEDAFKFAQENFDWSVIFPKLLTIVEENYKRFNVPKVLLKQII